MRVTTVAVVSVGELVDAVVVVGVTIVDDVSVGLTSVVPVADIGAVLLCAEVPDIVVESAFAFAPYGSSAALFSAASRLHAATRSRMDSAVVNLRIQ